MRTIEKPNTKTAKQSTVAIRIPARIARALDYHNVTAEKFIGDVMEVAFHEDEIDATLRTLYPRKGEPGEVLGLVLCGEND